MLARFALTAALVASCLSLASAQCSIPYLGTPVSDPSGGMLIDEWSGSIPIGFSFPFLDDNYSDIYVTDHGVVAFHNGGVPAAPNGGAQTYVIGTPGLASFGASVICAYWGDVHIGLEPESSVYVDNTSGSHCTITWYEHRPYGAFPGVNQFTVQLTLFVNGDIEFTFGSGCNNAASGFNETDLIIGVHAADDAVAAPIDLSAASMIPTGSFHEMWTGPGPAQTPDPSFDLAFTRLYMEQLSAGLGWVVTQPPIPCSETSTFGVGCGGLTLDVTSPAELGTEWTLVMSGALDSTPIAYLAFGAPVVGTPLDQVLPLIFDVGCFAYTDSSGPLVYIGPTNTGPLQVGVMIPRERELIGAEFTCQAVASTASGLSTSNGASITIGY